MFLTLEFDFSVNLARIVPDGLLVFFPSYYLLDQLIGYWKNMVSPPKADDEELSFVCLQF